MDNQNRNCNIKVVGILLLVCILILSFSGCGSEKGKVKESMQTSADSKIGLPENLVAQKTAHLTASSATINEYGIIVQNDAKLYGVVTLDGLHDTGAVYSSCTSKGGFFQVSHRNLQNTADGLNIYGLIDANGNTIIPESYAYFLPLNEYYVVAYRATVGTGSKDNSIVFYNSDSNYVGHGSGNGSLYNGTWTVYSTQSMAPVPGAEGSSASDYQSASGKYLTYHNDADERIICDENGNPVPEGAKILNDGFSVIETTDGAAAYNSDGERLFEYNPNEYSITDYQEGYLIARKYKDSKPYYFVVDQKGKIVSTEFESSFTVCGELLRVDKSIYNFKGEKIISGSYDSIRFDKMTRSCYALYKDDTYTLVTRDGTKLVSGDFSSPFSPKRGDDFYNFKNGSYSIKGYSLSSFTAKVTDGDGRYDAVDLLTGKTLFEGYSNITATEENNGGCYTLARRTEGGFDVWRIQNCIDAVKNGLENSGYISGETLRKIYEKRENLFDDLADAFKKEGLNAVIDKTSGDISLDTAVLFGGDSSEIKADGKKLLNKLMKIYVSVLSDSKYQGFVSKTMVEGHTAPIAGSTYESGLPLSKERAEKVRDYCLSSETGVDISKLPSKMEAIGYSNSKPVYHLDGTVNMDASRRVSFRLVIANVG